MLLSRRTFLTSSAALVVGLHALEAGRIFAADGSVVAGATGAAGPNDQTDPILVVLQLSGGNDGLNSVVPFGAGAYYDLRPNLGIKQPDTLQLSGSLGLHPELAGLKALYDAGKVAIVQGVGYPNPERSHFRSMEIWQTARPEGMSPVGWMGRYLDLTATNDDSPLKGVAVGASIPRALVASRAAVPAIESLQSFTVRTPEGAQAQASTYMRSLLRIYSGAGLVGPSYAMVRSRGTNALAAAERLSQAAGGYAPGVKYPATGLGADLQLVATMLAGGMGSRMIWLTQGGYDEHSGEKTGHGSLMREFGDAVNAFYQDLKAHGLSQRVLLLAHSEFGRRAAENASQGTDHGAAGPAFIIGDGVKGGVYGDHPSLTDLDDGDLKYGVDFRQIYATLLDGWLSVTHKDILGSSFDRLGFLGA